MYWCRDRPTSNLAALKDPVSRNHLSILVRMVECGQRLLGNWSTYIRCDRHAFPSAWTCIRCMSAYSAFEYTNMIIAHSLITLTPNAKPTDNCLLYNAFLITHVENLHRDYFFFLTTINLLGRNALVDVFVLRQGDSCTICDSLFDAE